MARVDEGLAEPSFGLKKFCEDGLLKEDGYALVLGHGMGDSIFLAGRGYFVDAVGENMAREEQKQGGLPISFYFGDISGFEVPPDTYDVIAANDALPMIQDKEVVARTIKKMADGLTAGGLLCLVLLGRQNRPQAWTPRSFFCWNEAQSLTAGLPVKMHHCAREEGHNKGLSGGLSVYSIYHFLHVKE